MAKRIVTPDQIEAVAWEGELARNETKAYRSPLFARNERAPRVTLGEPVTWKAEDLENETGKKWAPPHGDWRYALVRLAFTLHESDDARIKYTGATLTVYLRPRESTGRVIAHDLFPMRTTAENKGKANVTLKPDLKFASVIEFAPGEAGVEIEHHDVFPVIQAYGLGESKPYWKFDNHAANPLVGCQGVYLVLAASNDANGVRLAVELVAELETRFGPVHMSLPDDPRASLSRLIV